jgi:hypothetical protein
MKCLNLGTATTDLLTALLQAAAVVVVVVMRPLRLGPGLVQQGEVSMISIYFTATRSTSTLNSCES